MTPCRPVAYLASFTAPSTASAPLLEKKNISMLPGVTLASLSASSISDEYLKMQPEWMSESIWRFAASMTSGGQWPMLAVASPEEKSMYLFPSMDST